MSVNVRSRVSSLPRQQVLSDVLLVVVFALLMIPAARAQVEVGPVPFTLQVLFVLLTGLLLGPWRGAAAMALYAAVGFAGAPVFARGGGPAYFLGPTAGYIYGFVLAAFLTGFVARVLTRRLGPGGPGSRGVVRRFLRVELLAALAGLPVIYGVGVNHLALYYLLATDAPNPWGEAWTVGVGVFIWYDVLKAAIAAAIAGSAGLRREVSSGDL